MKYSWQLQAFDTEIFGFKTAKIEHIDNTDPNNIVEIVKQLILDLRKNNIEYSSYRLPAHDTPVIHALEGQGFVLVDAMLGLEKILDQNIQVHDKYPIRPAKIKDLKQLSDMVRGLFLQTRFYQDPIIPAAKADIIYQRWVENSVKGSQADHVLVWEENGMIQGFITLKNTGHIPLIGVDKNAQGKGIAKKLISSAENFLIEKNTTVVQLETQLINLPAIRAYLSSGFKPVSSSMTFRWISR